MAPATTPGPPSTRAGAGHIPQVTHPVDYVRTLTAFIRKHT